MKRTFLETLGLEKDVINKIMDEHGTTINGMKSQNENLQTQLSEAQTSLTTVQANHVAELATQKTEHENFINQLKKDSAIELSLHNAKVHNSKAVVPFLNYEAIEFEDDKLVGLDEQLESLKEKNGFLFQDEPNSTPPANPTQDSKGPSIVSSGNPTPPDNTPDEKDWRSRMKTNYQNAKK